MFTKHSEDVHSEPLFQQDFQQASPPLHGAGVSALVPRGLRPHAPRYYAVREHESPKNTHPAFWPEGHSKIDALGDIVEMHPRNMRQMMSQLSQRARSPLLSEDEEEAWRGEWALRPLHRRALADLHRAPQCYVDARSESQALAAELLGRGHHRPRKDGSEGHLTRLTFVQKKPHSRNPRHPHHSLRPRVKPKFEPRLTESDSMSAASSSDQQSSSADQYLQVTRGQGSFPRSAGQLGGRKADSRLELTVDLNDLICSDV